MYFESSVQGVVLSFLQQEDERWGVSPTIELPPRRRDLDTTAYSILPNANLGLVVLPYYCTQQTPRPS